MNIIKEQGRGYVMDYFDGDGFNENSGDFCNTLFILNKERFIWSYSGLNSEAFKDVCDAMEQLVNDLEYAENNKGYTYRQAMEENGLTFTPALRYRLLKWYRDERSSDIESAAEYLSIKTGKEWSTMEIHGYCQGDWCTVLYCNERYTNPEIEGQIWLGCCKEFSIQQDGDDTEIFGYYVADCQARTDEDYKKLVCDMEGLDPDNTRLLMIAGEHIQTVYEYREV